MKQYVSISQLTALGQSWKSQANSRTRHIDSYNFFVEHEIKEIVRANRTIRSDVDSNFWLEYAAWFLDLLPS